MVAVGVEEWVGNQALQHTSLKANAVKLVLFGMHNRTFGPYLQTIHRIGGSAWRNGPQPARRQLLEKAVRQCTCVCLSVRTCRQDLTVRTCR
jgi:hypothetical protein